ncbi:MAG: M13 family peptidase, partial [Chitinophagales bacterium]
MKKTSLFILSLIVVVTFFSCQPKPKAPQGLTADNFLKDYIDTTVKPGDDFFMYSMGTWVKNNPIPASERSWGIWTLVNEETYKRLRDINENAASANAEKGSNEQKIGDFWFTGMDTVTIAKQGISPLKPEFDIIDNIKTKDDVVSAVAHFQEIGVGAMCGIFPGQDEKNSNKYLIHLYQGGLGLPDRDYYFDNDGRTKNIRSEYVKHLGKMFVLMGEDSMKAKTDAGTVMRMETDLAKASRK